MKANDSGFIRCLLTLGLDDGVHVLFCLRHNLFYASGMNTAIENKIFQGYPCDLTPDRGEAGYCNSLRRIVYYKVNTCGIFQCSDVAPLASDKASFHIVRRQGNYRDRGGGGDVGSASLNGKRKNVACLLLRLFF